MKPSRDAAEKEPQSPETPLRDPEPEPDITPLRDPEPNPIPARGPLQTIPTSNIPKRQDHVQDTP
jgi:hypothetical protein